MRRVIAHRRGLLGVAAGVALCAVVVVTAIAGDRSNDKETPSERAQRVLREAAGWQQRPCHKRPDITVYALGQRFAGEYATRLGARCETRDNNAEVFYGPCRDGGESGCANAISVRSAPACKWPYAWYEPRPKLVTLRGVPAALFEERIELLTRDTTITIFADPKIAREAVDALRPAARTTTQTSLPTPAAGVVGRDSSAACRRA